MAERAPRSFDPTLDLGRVKMALAKYHLLFKHPFGTAHGFRVGTDAVFVRLEQGGISGYGEATLPPYLSEDQGSVYQELQGFGLEKLRSALEKQKVGFGSALDGLSGPARAALSMAYHDMLYKELGIHASSYLTEDLEQAPKQLMMVTLGHSELADIPLKLKELPNSEVLKVKLGSNKDRETLELVTALDSRRLMLDANQGWHTVDDALHVLNMLGKDRVVGIEQPFAKGRWDLHKELSQRTTISVYGDESIQGLDDLREAPGTFDGVNLKLMKCGGLDVALEMILEAQVLGLKVMLGSMSESSLGCGAMANLAPAADLLDLDGPWLIQNDPFEGLELQNGRLTVSERPGLGIEPRHGAFLDWHHIGA